MNNNVNTNQMINNNPNKNDNNEKNKKKVRFIVIGIVSAIIILISGVFLLLVLGGSYISSITYDDTDNKNSIDNTNNINKYEWYTPAKSNYKIDVHYDIKNQNYSNVHFKTDDNSDGEILGTYYCESSSCKSIAVSEKGYVLIKDINYIIYDYKSDKAIKLNSGYITSNQYHIRFLEKNNELAGIYFTDSGYSYFIPVGSEKTITIKGDSYGGIIKGDYLLVSNGKVINYYNLKSGILDKTVDVKASGSVELISKNNDLLYIDVNYMNGSGYVTIYNNNLSEVLKFQTTWYYIDDKYIYTYDSKQRNLDKYDLNGKLVKRIDNIDIVSSFDDGYLFIVDNKNKLKLADLDNNVIKEFETIQDGKQAFYQEDGEEFPYGLYGYDKNRNLIKKISARIGKNYRTYIYNTVTGEKSSVDYSK